MNAHMMKVAAMSRVALKLAELTDTQSVLLFREVREASRVSANRPPMMEGLSFNEWYAIVEKDHDMRRESCSVCGWRHVPCDIRVCDNRAAANAAFKADIAKL